MGDDKQPPDFIVGDEQDIFAASVIGHVLADFCETVRLVNDRWLTEGRTLRRPSWWWAALVMQVIEAERLDMPGGKLSDEFAGHVLAMLEHARSGQPLFQINERTHDGPETLQ